jgi:hypothetical protein
VTTSLSKVEFHGEPLSDPSAAPTTDGIIPGVTQAPKAAPAPPSRAEAASLADRQRGIAEAANFPSAARALASAMLATASTEPILDAIWKDAGRYVGSMIVIYLHLTGGLNLARLQKACATHGMLSPGRARLMLNQLLHLGLLEVAPPTADGGGKGPAVTYRPAAGFLAAWWAHLAAALAATAIVEPRIDAILARLGEPTVALAVQRRQCEGFLDADLRPVGWPDVAGVLMHRLAGWQIIADVLTRDEQGGAFPPRGPIAFSIAASARRFTVSRVHIRRFLKLADEAGLLSFDGDGTVTLSEDGRSQFAAYYAFQLASLAAVAEDTLTELAAGAPPGPT